MTIDKRKTQNIITIVVVALALVLVLIVALVKKGVIKLDKVTTQEYIIESTIVTVAQTDENGEHVTDENGEVIYYTMVDYYSKPSISSNHRYPVVTKATTGTTAPDYYYEYTESVGVTDADGNAVTNENGEWVTKINKQTQKCDENGNPIVNGTTAPPTTTELTEPSVQTTSVVYRTLPNGKPIKDIHGNPVVKDILTEAPTEPPTTTTKPVVLNGNTTTTTKKATTTAKKTTTTEKPSESESVTEPSTESTTEQTTNPNPENTNIADNLPT